MWVMGLKGPYSVVAHRDKPGTVLVRSRLKGALEALRPYLEPSSTLEVFEDLSADYRYRAEMSKYDFATAMWNMVMGIDYPNFKNRVQAISGTQLHNVYTKVWSDLGALQPGGPYSGWYGSHDSAWSKWTKQSTMGFTRSSTGYRVCEDCGAGLSMRHKDGCAYKDAAKGYVRQDETIPYHEYRDREMGIVADAQTDKLQDLAAEIDDDGDNDFEIGPVPKWTVWFEDGSMDEFEAEDLAHLKEIVKEEHPLKELIGWAEA